MGNCWPKPIENLASNNRLSSPNPQDHGNKTVLKLPWSPTLKKPSASSPTRNGDGVGGGGANKRKDGGEVPASGKIVTPNLKVFTLAELKSATRKFRPDPVLGEGGFGRVFKGWVDEKTFAPAKVGVGMAVAVKKSNPDSEQGLKESQAEVKFLGKFSHPNLVKLVGYCWEEKEFLLVYEYMQKGSLESHLFRSKPPSPVTSTNTAAKYFFKRVQKHFHGYTTEDSSRSCSRPCVLTYD